MNKKNILLVDNEHDPDGMLQKMIKRLGCEIFCAQNCTEALEALENKDVDLIILDLMMPELEGIDIMRSLRRTGITIPIVISSSLPSVILEQAMKTLGPGKFISRTNSKELRNIIKLTATTLRLH